MKDNQTNQNENVRFTTLINPTLLSQLKLISYFTNHKVYEMMNNSISLLIKDVEETHNTKIEDIIKLSTTFSQNKVDDIIIEKPTKN